MKSSAVETGQREDSRSIWVFTPSRTDPKDLEAILVQRHELLKDAVERVRESALTANKHHLLFVGPRGCGKTHLVTLIVSRIRADTEASQQMRLAWLNEDETCTSLLELLIKIHTALEKRYPDEFRNEDLDGAYERSPTAALDFVSTQLLASLGSKTLVIVTENWDALFEAMGKEGQKQLRAFIQEHPQLTIVATAQRLVEDLADRTSPFFGFFQTEHLKLLTADEATTLLQNIARVQGKTEVTEFLATSRGRARVRALHHLSGGNHRIYIVLSQFLTRETIDALVSPFLKMVDELTPYYQERVRWLPPLQRKIVEMLCTCETTVPVKEIARRLFASQQTISSQLKDLREKGYVESDQHGRESLYQVSEPLMRICVEVKENQDTQPLRLLVDFLRVWYDDAELKRRLGLCQPESTSFSYLSAAIERNKKEGNLRITMLVKNVFGAEATPIDADVLKRLETNLPEDFFVALQCHADGDMTGALESVEQAVFTSATAASLPLVLLLRGWFRLSDGDWATAITDFTRVIEQPGALPDVIARALFNRGVSHGKLGDRAAENADYTRVVELPNVTPELVARALINRGLTHSQQGDSTNEFEDYTRVLNLPGAPPEHVATALLNRGVTFGELGDEASAIADFTQVIELSGALPEQIARALLNRGVTYGQWGDTAAAIADYTRVIELTGGHDKIVAQAHINRAASRGQLGDGAAEIADYTHVIEMVGAPPEELGVALFDRGVAYGEMGDDAAAIADLSSVIRMFAAPPNLVARALYLRAAIQFQANQRDISRRDLEALICLAGAPINFVIAAHLSLANLHFREGWWSAGFAALEECLRIGEMQTPPCFDPPVDTTSIFFSADLDPEGRQNHTGRLFSLYANFSALALLGEALVKHLGGLFTKGAPWPASDNLNQWLTAWENAAGESAEFKLPLRLLRTGIEFINAGGKDHGVLLTLTTPERTLLRQALGLETTEN